MTAYDAPRGDRVELDTNVSGEPVSWLAQDEIDRLIFDTESTPPPGGMPRRGRRKRMARVTSLGLHGRVSAARNVARR